MMSTETFADITGVLLCIGRQRSAKFEQDSVHMGETCWLK